MQKFNVDIKRGGGAAPQIPAGAYIAKILGAQVCDYTWGSQLVISFDIDEGEYKGFFADRYRGDDGENKKWKGVYRLTIPQEGGQYYDSQLKKFGNALACIEESNIGYSWNWDENTLKNKRIGVLFRDEEYDIEGRRGWASKCFALLTVDEVLQGKFRIPQPKPLKEAPKPVASFDNTTTVDDDDLPF